MALCPEMEEVACFADMLTHVAVDVVFLHMTSVRGHVGCKASASKRK